MVHRRLKKPLNKKMIKYNGKITVFLFILMCISDPAFAMLSRLASIEPRIAKTFSVALNQATKHRSLPTFTPSHHTFSTTKETTLKFELRPNVANEGCVFKPQKSTSHTVSADNTFRDICFDFQKLSAEMSVRFFAEDVFEAKLAEVIKANKEAIFLEFEEVKNARELGNPTSNIMCGSLKQDAYDAWRINTSTYDHRRLMLPTYQYLLSLCYHFPNFCFLTKDDIKDLYISSIRDSIENNLYMPLRIFELLGKSKIPAHAMTIDDFKDCLRRGNAHTKIKGKELEKIYLSSKVDK